MKNIGYNPVLTTLIKLNFITMKEPDKWCVAITPENREAIEKWRTANVTLNGRGYCVNKTSFNSMIGYWYPDKPGGYTEISFEEFKVYTSKPKDLTGRYVKCLVDGAQGTKCKAGEIYKLVSLYDIMETQVYKLEDGLCLCISPNTSDRWELLPEDYSVNEPLKQAVHCKTQEEWDFILSKFNPNKLQSNHWDVYKKESCFSLQENCERDGYTSVRHFKVDEVKILSFQEWCNLNGYKMEKEVKFEVGDYVVLQYSSAKEIGYDTDCNNTRLKAGHIDKIANFRNGQTLNKNPKIRWVGLGSDPYNGIVEILLRHATQEEINNYLISIGQIPAEKYPFKKLEEDDLTWEIKTEGIRRTEPISMTNENWKPKMILSIDDEELPMVNIIKTNTIKQLLNNN